MAAVQSDAAILFAAPGSAPLWHSAFGSWPSWWPEFLPASDPRRQEWDQNRAASAQYSNTVQASRLEGITVILDAGHGGEDPGTNHQGTWESVYVYDVMLRVKALLEQTTAADVLTPPHHAYTELLLKSVPELRGDWLDTLRLPAGGGRR